MKIDAHQHYYKLSRGSYGWIEKDSAIYADFMPDKLKKELDRYGIQKTIVVQAEPSVDETYFLLQLCEREETLIGVVGWLDLESDSFYHKFMELRANPLFIGIRPMMLYNLKDDRWLLRAKVIENFKVLLEYDFPIDLLVRPRHLPYVIELLEILPSLRVVINHLAKPEFAHRRLEPWKTHMSEIAKYEKAYCKLSGMVTEINHKVWSAQDFIPYVSHAIDVFGTKRVMFGSDWPVCLLSADYGKVLQVLHDSLPNDLSSDERNLIFGQNAIDFYRLEINSYDIFY